MRIFTVTVAAAVSVALAACEARVGKEDESAGSGGNAAAPVSAAGKAEEGSVSINAPGFDLKFDIPAGMAEQVEIDADSKIVYPNAKLGGIHVEAGAHAEGKENSGVELRFTSTDDPAKVAAWYRDPARASGFTLKSAKQEGDGFVIAGTQAGGEDPFTVHLTPRTGGGTDARIVLVQRG